MLFLGSGHLTCQSNVWASQIIMVTFVCWFGPVTKYVNILEKPSSFKFQLYWDDPELNYWDDIPMLLVFSVFASACSFLHY